MEESQSRPAGSYQDVPPAKTSYHDTTACDRSTQILGGVHAEKVEHTVYNERNLRSEKVEVNNYQNCSIRFFAPGRGLVHTLRTEPENLGIAEPESIEDSDLPASSVPRDGAEILPQSTTELANPTISERQNTRDLEPKMQDREPNHSSSGFSVRRIMKNHGTLSALLALSVISIMVVILLWSFGVFSHSNSHSSQRSNSGDLSSSITSSSDTETSSATPLLTGNRILSGGLSESQLSAIIYTSITSQESSITPVPAPEPGSTAISTTAEISRPTSSSTSLYASPSTVSSPSIPSVTPSQTKKPASSISSVPTTLSTCVWGCPGWACADLNGCQDPMPCVQGHCCNWGCPGWDCDNNVPCMKGYTCQSGVCH